MSLLISGDLRLRRTWQPMDTDAAAYITAVETADGQALEEKTKIAIDNFVLGCKQDGIWNAIKASCILAGARTLAGALIPLVGTAPTSFSFVDGDYNRKTGLVGDGTSKYLNSNRANNADPQDNKHLCVYATQAKSANGQFGWYLGDAGTSVLGMLATNKHYGRLNDSNAVSTGSLPAETGTIAASRSAGTLLTLRLGATSYTVSANSTTPTSVTTFAYRREDGGYSNARLAFYSIGESLNLALLDARVTDLINAFAVAIP